jgi:bacterioferritin
MNIAGELEKHAAEELSHALIISNQIDYLGGMPTVQPKPVRTSEKPKEMLHFDLTNEGETIRNYRERVRQCEQLSEYGMAEHIREILMDEQDHQIALPLRSHPFAFHDFLDPLRHRCHCSNPARIR